MTESESVQIRQVATAFACRFLGAVEDPESFAAANREWVARLMAIGEEGGISATIDFGAATISSLVRITRSALDDLAEATHRPPVEVAGEFLARMRIQ
jgi:hypothetical protein